MVYARTRIRSKDCDAFGIQTDHLIPTRWLGLIKKTERERERRERERTYRLLNFVVHKRIIKESEKQILGSCQRTKNEPLKHEGERDTNCRWCLRTVFKCLKKKNWGRIQTSLTTALLMLDRIFWSVLETWGDFLPFWLHWKTHREYKWILLSQPTTG